MTRTEALREAAKRWPDVGVFAVRRHDAQRARRFVVGVIGVSGAEIPCGAGASFEDAFAFAESSGIDAERVRQTRENMARISAGGDERDHRLALAAARRVGKANLVASVLR